MRKRIWIVADDWEALERYEDVLSPEFETECCGFARDAFSRLRESADATEEAFLLLDLVLEDLTPREAEAELDRDPILCRIPRFWILSEETHEDPSFTGEMRGVVRRPFSFTALREGLRSFVIHRAVSNSD